MKDLHLPLYLQESAQFLIFLAWYFKVVWTALCQVLGWRKRHRSPWIVVGNLMCVIMSLSLMAPTHSI